MYRIAILITAVGTLVPAHAQEYVYPNRKLADRGLLEYRRYTLEEAQAYQEGGSFDPYLPLDWGPERRLTEQENVYRARPLVKGDSIFCTYFTTSARATYFIKSLNLGYDWEPYITLEDTTRVLFHFFPEITRNGSNLLIGFMAQWMSHGNNLCFYKSTNSGQTWGSLNEILTNYSDYRYHFSSFCNVGARIYASYLNHLPDSLYVLVTDNWGDTWNVPGVNVAYLNSTPQPMTVRASGNDVHLVWVNENRPISCRYSRSTDMGQMWSQEIDIAEDSSGAQRVYVAVQDTHVVVCWMGYKYSPYMFTGDLFIKQSFDSGETWGEAEVLTDLHKVMMGTIYVEDSLLIAVWMDARFGGNNNEVMVRYSHDHGISWTEEERLSFGDFDSHAPISCATEDMIHVFWGDGRGEAPGLYYCVNDPSTDIEDKENSPPLNISLSSYPNPFNARTIITYKNIEGGDIRIYNLTGQLVRTQATFGKEGTIIWDATDDAHRQVSSGVYFVKARSSTGTASAKIVYLR